jgi:sulfur-oxidizing protein SoxY
MTALRIFRCVIAALVLGLSPAPAADDPWPGLADDIFKGRPIADGTGLLAVEMPARAEDAAIVPVTMRAALPHDDPRRVKALTLVIDQNPAPVAATFTLGDDVRTATLASRVRVNSYTNVHLVAELSDGKLYAVQTFVKASGGCAAPALKNADEARRTLGQMRFRLFPPEGSNTAREAQIMIRHPNNSGLQMDQLTRHYIPPFFVRGLKIWQGDALVLAMEGGISLSEDPNIRFSYVPNGAATFRVEVTDTDDNVFTGEWPATSAM